MEGWDGKGKAGSQIFVTAVLSEAIYQALFFKGPGYLSLKPDGTKPRFCVLLPAAHSGESQLDPAKLLCLKPKSTLACFHGNGKRTNASDMTPLF